MSSEFIHSDESSDPNLPASLQEILEFIENIEARALSAEAAIIALEALLASTSIPDPTDEGAVAAFKATILAIKKATEEILCDSQDIKTSREEMFKIEE